jgi:hypothetical protein
MFADLLQFELRLRCRRRQLHLFRWLYAAWLLYLFGRYFLPSLQPRADAWTAAQTADRFEWLGGSFIALVLGQRFLFVILATPAFVAGQITEEKQRGVLQFVLLTELQSGQVVSAKLLAQGYLLSTVLLLDVPLLLLARAFEDFSLETLLAHCVCMVTLVFALGAMSLLAAVWCRTTLGVLAVVYGAAAVMFAGGAALEAALGQAAAGPAPAAVGRLWWWLRALLGVVHPAYVLDEIAGRGPAVGVGLRLLAFALLWGTVALGLAAVAARRLRPACLAQLQRDQPAGKSLQRVSHPPVGDDPVAWKACHVEGILPGGFAGRWGRWTGVLAAAGIAAPLAIWETRVSPSPWPLRTDGLVLTGLFALLALVRSALAMPAERNRDTLDALLLSGWFSSDLADSMFVGVTRAFRPAVLACGAVMVILSIPAGLAAVVSAAAWAAMVWITVWVTALFGFAVSTSRSGALFNIGLTAVASVMLVPLVGSVHFLIAGLSRPLTVGSYANAGEWAVGTALALLLTQLTVIVLALTSRWLRFQILVHDKGWEPKPLRRPWAEPRGHHRGTS